MNIVSVARNLSGALIAASALFVIGGFLWALIFRGRIIFEPGSLIAVPIIIAPFLTALGVVSFAFRRKRAELLLPLWAFALGVAAPFVPPTILELVTPCPPPATQCGFVGSAPWPILLVGFVGAVLACYASWAESHEHRQPNNQLTPIGNRLRAFGASLALIAGMMFIWLHYDFDARSIEQAVYAALSSERARAAGGIPFADSVDGPSESLTLLIGFVTTLTVGAASFRSSVRSLIHLWPFVIGVIWPQFMAVVGSVGSFGWEYRTFAEKYGWATLLVICCLGLATAQLAKKHIVQN